MSQRLGLCHCRRFRVARRSHSRSRAAEAPKILMIVCDGLRDLELMLSREVGVMKRMLEESGFKVEVATDSGKPTRAGSVQLGGRLQSERRRRLRLRRSCASVHGPRAGVLRLAGGVGHCQDVRRQGKAHPSPAARGIGCRPRQGGGARG